MHGARGKLANGFSAAATIFLITVLCVAAAEGLAGLWLRRLSNSRPVFMVAYTDDQIRRLYGTEDFAKVREALAETWREDDTVYSPFVEFRMSPVSGKWLNVSRDGYRSNGHGPQDLTAAGPKVFVFGGSTTYGSGVADDQTIPAYLEDALKAAGNPAQVFNFGAISWFSTPERIALERDLTAAIKPDLAVFVDGLNDFYYCAVPDRSAWYERLMQATRGRSREPLWVELAVRSNVVRMSRLLGGDRSVVVGDWSNFCGSDADVDKVIDRLETNRRMLSAIAERLEFKVLFVTQPVPTWHYDNAKRPVPVNEEMLGYHVNSGRGYARMAERRSARRLSDSNHLWLAELEPADENAYVDTVHYSPAFNRLIADAIAARIVEDRLLPSRRDPG